MRPNEESPYRCREEWEERNARQQVLKIWGLSDQQDQAAQFLACWRSGFWRHPFKSLLDLPLVVLSFIRVIIFTHVLTHLNDDLTSE